LYNNNNNTNHTVYINLPLYLDFYQYCLYFFHTST